MKSFFCCLLLLICSCQFYIAQTNTTSDYLRRSDSVFTSLFGNDNWKRYYKGEAGWMTLTTADGNRSEVRNDSLAETPVQIQVPYTFRMPGDLKINQNCTSIELRLQLKFDNEMNLENPEELDKIPAFIKTADRYLVLHPEKIKKFAEQYNLEKGLGDWHYCLSYNDSTQKLIWTVGTKLKEETAEEQEQGKNVLIDALNGEFIAQYETVTQNLSKHPEKYKRK